VAISGDDVSKVYETIKDFATNIHAIVQSKRIDRAQQYDAFFRDFEAYSADYIECFQVLIDGIPSEVDYESYFREMGIEADPRAFPRSDYAYDVDEVKKTFFARSAQFRTKRLLSKVNASGVLNATTDIREQRFLTCLVLFFYYEESGGDQLITDKVVDDYISRALDGFAGEMWRTPSTALLDKIEGATEKEVIVAAAIEAMRTLVTRAEAVVRYYTIMRRNW